MSYLIISLHFRKTRNSPSKHFNYKSLEIPARVSQHLKPVSPVQTIPSFVLLDQGLNLFTITGRINCGLIIAGRPHIKINFI